MIMFKSKIFYNSLLLCGLLASVATLTACGQQQVSPATTDQPSAVQEKGGQSHQEKVADKKLSTTPSSSQGDNQSEVDGSAETLTSVVDLDAIARGDFSSIAGTWKNGQGKSFTFTSDGLQSEFAEEKIVVIESKRYETSAVVTIGFEVNGEPEGGAIGIVIYPAGVKTAYGEADERDHLQAGHSVQREEAQERYYKQ